MILLVPFCPYHFVRTILSISFCLYSFIHYGDLYSASSRLLLRSATDPCTVKKMSFEAGVECVRKNTFCPYHFVCIPFCPYHFVCTPFCPYHFVCIPFSPYPFDCIPFCPYHFVCIPFSPYNFVRCHFFLEQLQL